MGAKENYEQEQAKLRKQHDGEPIHIDVPRAPEVRPEVYRDVEALLFRGFLTVPANINGVLFVFKSLNQHEFEQLRFLGGGEEHAEPTAKFWDMFLAYGVFLVDGANILPHRDDALPKLAESFAQFQRAARQKIIRHLSEVNRRASNAITLTEAYAMENYSRFRWGQLQGLDLMRPSVTGIAGTELLGMNWGQLLWRAINYYEDLHQRSEQDWENAKFVGGCFAGKGLNKIHGQDRQRREKDRDEKAARKDKLLRHILLGEPLAAAPEYKGGVKVQVAHTVEDLATQLEHDLRGDKDFHDKVVEAHEARVREQFRARRQQIEELARQREREYNGKPVLGSTEMDGLTPEEVRQRVARSKQLRAQQAASRMVHPELEDPRMENFLNKWGMLPAAAVSTTDQDTSNVVALPPAREAGKPFRR